MVLPKCILHTPKRHAAKLTPGNPNPTAGAKAQKPARRSSFFHLLRDACMPRARASKDRMIVSDSESDIQRPFVARSSRKRDW